ncbi:type II toxin-antitoxin system HipA family toxin [Marinospirillum sp.]|uniref:type II toxin-antitoxin system HipA family toxin n=1 Tax=Marinospirillum sp. TaxID=2183934 RepID=UPI00287097AE|nr:type II toxin-antitoxin system HipA family toxin [Marinospirillum sp.]MDR9467735.1 type II toxin-antitoxin system HipA family toxin [Marinospirillum sp.]
MSKSALASVLELRLHDTQVGFLTGYRDGLNIFTFSREYQAAPQRPTLTLTTHPAFPRSEALMSQPWVRRQRLHPVLSNLLPEGALRVLLAQALKTHPDNEFELLTWLGQDLPGALVAHPLEPDAIPDYVLDHNAKAEVLNPVTHEGQNRFSLAGVQMKFSMQEREGRYRIAKTGALGDWIIKTPSTIHKHVPLNEYTAMQLARLAGIDIPDTRLVPMSKVEQWPQINLPEEDYAFAIRRFDRHQGTRVHMEDFAQILAKYPHEKYQGGNYQQLARILYQYSKEGLQDVQQFARRLLVNILLANGDAHLKNWSLIYPDTVTPELSPAYDIVTTRVYMHNEQEFALNLGKAKAWYQADLQQFQYWAEKSDIPWRAIRPHLLDTLEKARSLWPEELKQLPMADQHKQILKDHWQNLQPDFRIT